MIISIVTVVRNGEATIAQTLASVAAQEGQEYEHIIVDGASTDNTLQIARRHQTSRVRIISEPDLGIYDAMSKGLRMATGDVVGFLNADDFFCRVDALASIAAEFRSHPTLDAVSGGLVLVDQADTSKIARAVSPFRHRPWAMRFGVMPPHPSTYVRRDAAMKIGGFDGSFAIGGDFDWFVRFFYVHRFRIGALRKTLVAQRKGGVSTQGLASARRLNADISRSLRQHGIASSPLLVWSKYVVKIWQFTSRPSDFPPPGSVRFE
ncbi:MAG: glycosyltransferase [Hyphomicrobiales bacterium]|nr:MAG: glycosyltransferase [Hyphomicrobiales bacterium]